MRISDWSSDVCSSDLFFRKNDLSDVPYMPHAAKKREYDYAEYSETLRIQMAWLYRVRQLAAEMVAPKYAEKSLRAFANEMPKYMADPEEVRHVSRALAAYGVRYVVVEPLPKAEINGVCFWLDSNSPVIGMTTRHEIGRAHV